jgi:DNA (cytosine-5)-methyltransferase 1
MRKFPLRKPPGFCITRASLECTNFSKAKGGQPRDADSRTLADHLDRYVIALNPDYIQIENVVEFMSWGPLDEKGKPVSRKNGQDWMRWRKLICSHGYRDQWQEMNAANYAAYTSRNRLFGIFAKDGLPIVFPTPTHAKNPSRFSMHGDLQKWKAVKEVLNFQDEGQSIFNRRKPLSDKTLERIYAGLLKYVAKGDRAFISKYYSGKPSGKNIPVEGPAGTVTCIDGQSLVQADFLLKYNSMSKDGKHTPPSVDEPAPVISCQGRLGLVHPQFLSSQNSSVENPMGTLTTKDRAALVSPEYFIDKHYGTSQNQSIHQPAGSILPTDKHRLVKCEPFIMPTNYNNRPTSIEDPSPTITANRKHHYIVNPSHGGHSTSVDAPCPVIIARQDKAPLYFVQVESGKVAIAVYPEDSEVMTRIKEFMVIYELVDIKMRMLRVLELLQIQGFPNGYRLEGNQADQKKFIGNSVVPHVVTAWTMALGNRILEQQKSKVA